MTKPLVFNYKDYKDLKEAYKVLLEDNNKLIVDNRRLREINNQYRIRLRIEEAEREQ